MARTYWSRGISIWSMQRHYIVESHESGNGIPIYSEGEACPRLSLGVVNTIRSSVLHCQSKSFHYVLFNFLDRIRRDLAHSQ